MTLDFSSANADLQAQNSQQVTDARQAGLDQGSADLLAAQVRPATVKVQSGDTFTAYAAVYKVTVDQIKSWNPDVDPNAMQLGEKVWLIDPATVTGDVTPPPVEPPPDPDPVPPPDPTPGKLVLGHVALHGSGGWLDKAKAAEAKFGKFAGPMRDYYQPGDNMLPKADHKAWLDSDPDHTVLINIKPGPDWAGAGTGSNVGVIQAMMAAWKTYILQGRVKFIIWHEPENDGKPLADYIPMWKRVVGIMRGVVPEVKVGFCSISYFPDTTKDTAYYRQNLWAGAEWVDFFAPDPYSVKSAPASRLPDNMIAQAKVLRALPGAANLPVVAAEWGADLGGGTTSRGTDQHRADSIDAVTARLGDLIAAGYVGLTYYDDGSDYLSANGPDVAAYKRLKAATEAL